MRWINPRILTELTAIEEYTPGALQRINTAIDAGEISGYSYGACVLHHALKGTKVYQGRTESPEYTFSEILCEKLYNNECGILYIERLVVGVHIGDTAGNCDALEQIQQGIKQIQG